MGVKFKDIVLAENIDIEKLEGRVIAIDAANTLYQFLSSIRQRDGTPLMDEHGRVTSHLSGLFYRTSALIGKGIKPVFVFDGERPKEKEDTVKQRSAVRQESEKQWKEALAEGDVDRAAKFAKRSSRMTPRVVEESKKLLGLMGVPFVQAAGEGEAQASYMVNNGDAWAVSSQDYDCLLFGAPRIVRNLTISRNLNSIELLDSDRILRHLDISREQLIDVSLMVGTDFNKGIKGIGAKRGLKLIQNHDNLESAVKEIDVDFEEDIGVLRDIFLNHPVNMDYDLKWDNVDIDGLVEFMSYEHSFSEERVINTAKKIKKHDVSQQSLEAWF